MSSTSGGNGDPKKIKVTKSEASLTGSKESMTLAIAAISGGVEITSLAQVMEGNEKVAGLRHTCEDLEG